MPSLACAETILLATPRGPPLDMSSDSLQANPCLLRPREALSCAYVKTKILSLQQQKQQQQQQHCSSSSSNSSSAAAALQQEQHCSSSGLAAPAAALDLLLEGSDTILQLGDALRFLLSKHNESPHAKTPRQRQQQQPRCCRPPTGSCQKVEAGIPRGPRGSSNGGLPEREAFGWPLWARFLRFTESTSARVNCNFSSKAATVSSVRCSAARQSCNSSSSSSRSSSLETEQQQQRQQQHPQQRHEQQRGQQDQECSSSSSSSSSSGVGFT
ncbi:hypothetical protein Emag_004726 [Eimeria magna]